MPPTEEEAATSETLQAEYDRLEEAQADAEDVPEEVERRLAEIEAALSALDERPMTFDSAEVARAGAFVSIDIDGRLRVERGFVRPEDELPVEPEPQVEAEPEADGARSSATPARIETGGDAMHAEPEASSEEPEEDGVKPIPDRLLTELTAYRTLALREAMSRQPNVAFRAVLHALCLKLFYRYALDSCLELEVKGVALGAQAPGLHDTPAARALERGHQAWLASLPKQPEQLWDFVDELDNDHL